MSLLPAPARHFRAALVFMTRVPVTGIVDDADARSASAYFSWVGALVGGLASVMLCVTRVGPWVDSVLAVGATMLVTGALHEDGLADTADAMGGSYEREKLFTILKDPRIGSFGAAALFVVTFLRIASLVALGAFAPLAPIFAHATSRLACTAMLASMPYVTADATAKSRSVVDARAWHVGVAAVPTVAMVAWVALGAPSSHEARVPFAMGASLAASVLVGVLLAWRFHARAGGITGDFLGATQQLVEATIYVTLAAVLP